MPLTTPHQKELTYSLSSAPPIRKLSSHGSLLGNKPKEFVKYASSNSNSSTGSSILYRTLRTMHLEGLLVKAM